MNTTLRLTHSGDDKITLTKTMPPEPEKVGSLEEQVKNLTDEQKIKLQKMLKKL